MKMNDKVIKSTQYMLDNTDKFISAVFSGEDRYIDACAGLVAAHGDKTEQYRYIWEEAGLDFNKAQVIYFLTYTKLLGDTPKHMSCQWVIDNYNKYNKLLP
ncbi:hypothetical protein KEN51_CDS0096 [Pseudomonas phage vB_Pae10145-KEN51]|uniref:hypothetical protein n=1 Tax=Pseudomonas aeruginosa TaxID=287 RepID=UPI0018C18D26|nr:hypothetical protein [Pseudomonas aeruginosa]QOV08170.1 hypothetical protein [Pseudomonas phage vB_PaeM_kmuB]UNI71563.1 hypothetical protein Churi01_gp038 [Pseudomonas phage Churi01]USL86539.1 hypothetical protein CDGHABPJ_00075 [Pseudomonas phage OMKO1]WAX23489.1 hypothetical protein [Pseudomonas phage pPA-N1803-4At.2]WNV47986.1 hypothetical protein [Pseudomonas phage fMGyn-Pae01]WNV49915.1 hypothetical protein [Pseudomonas phage ANB1]WNV50317.1 hypothetical protein [Pseudomonas phage Ph